MKIHFRLELLKQRAPFDLANLSAALAVAASSCFISLPSLAAEPCNPTQSSPFPQSCQVAINGQNWEIGVVRDSFGIGTDVSGLDLTDAVNAPWWGSDQVAVAFASAVGWGLGFPNNAGFTGPIFAFSFPDGYEIGTTIGRAAASSQNSNIYVDGGSAGVVSGFAFAKSVPAPGPLPVLGLAISLGMSRKLRRTIKRSSGSCLGVV